MGAVVHILTASASKVAGEGGHNDDESAAADGDDSFQVGHCGGKSDLVCNNQFAHHVIRVVLAFVQLPDG